MYLPKLRSMYYIVGVTGLTILASTFYMARHVFSGSQILRKHSGSIFNLDRFFADNATVVYDPRASIYGGRVGEPRKETCVNCFRVSFDSVINEPGICNTSDGAPIEMLLMITSIQERKKHRDIIRKTWASVTRNNSANVRHVFLFGRQTTQHKNELLALEAAQHHDMVMDNFRDTYRNLTLKTLMGLKWVTKHCSNAKYIFKTDDDMWLSVSKILDLPKKYNLKKTLAGMCLDVSWPHRNKGSKWYASYLSYPGTTYPGFCTGTAYLMTNETAQDIYRVSPHVPFFHLEDVYVALCIKRLGYRLLNVPGFNNIRAGFDPCRYSSEVITSHYVSTGDIERAWKKNCTLDNDTQPTNVIRIVNQKKQKSGSSAKLRIRMKVKNASPNQVKAIAEKLSRGELNIAELRNSKLAASFFKVSSDISKLRRRSS